MNKKQARSARNLHDDWEHAIERAGQEKQDRRELDADALNDAAGLHVQSGVQAGWMNTGSCGQQCSFLATC